MKLEKLVGDRFKERPADCVIDSHALMVKGGYIKYVANGIYSSFLPLKRITRKIEQILREEMDKVDGQEVQFPVVMPASIWEESGRYESIGDELLRFTDRNGAKMVLGMTHEEAAVQLVREYAQSYTKYPFMIYQIQTKFRDEARPRAGLIRVREFTMKDAYSFHTSQEDLEQYYQRVHKAYERIFERAGIPEVVSVASDSGMMGGSLSHEFMLLTPIGEDSIVLCDDCGYKANMEAAENISDIPRAAESAELEKVHTPNIHTIEDICEFFGDKTNNSCKAVVYQKNSDDSYVVVFIRGDLEINETKLVNYLGDQIHAAVITEECGLNAGYIGPVGLHINAPHVVLYDKSLEGRNNLSCGANEEEYHFKGLDMERDVKDAEYHDFAKVYEGGICPKCGKKAEVYSRITGYYRPVQNWNDGKAQEYKNRTLYDVMHSQLKKMKPVHTSVVTMTEDDVKIQPVTEHKYLFTTSTCPNCKMAKKMLEGEELEIIDAEKNPEMAREFGIMQAPTLVVMSGKNVTKYVNASNIQKYVDDLEE